MKHHSYTLTRPDDRLQRLLGGAAMPDRYFLPDGHGGYRVMYSTERVAQAYNLPTRVILRMPCALGILDKLAGNQDMPTIDIDAVLSSAMEGMHRNSSQIHQDLDRVICGVLERVMESHAMALQDKLVSRHHLEMGLRSAFNACFTVLSYHNLYNGGVLLYDYEQRRGTDAVVLIRKRYADFD